MSKSLKLPAEFPPKLPLKLVQKRNFKHLKMRFDCNATLIVNLPKYASKRACEDFIATNIQWILAHFSKNQQTKEAVQTERFYLFGEWVEFDSLNPYLDEKLLAKLQKVLQDSKISQSSPSQILSAQAFLSKTLPTKSLFTQPSLFQAISQEQCDSALETQKAPSSLLSALWQAVVQESLETQDSTQTKLKAVLCNLYKKALESYTAPRIKEFSQTMQLFPSSVSYGKSYRQLGCCKTKQRSIRLSLRLALMPLECVDSVIIHELAHLRYPNHQKEFWNLVKAFDKNPKSVQEWLATNSPLNARLYQCIFKTNARDS